MQSKTAARTKPHRSLVRSQQARTGVPTTFPFPLLTAHRSPPTTHGFTLIELLVVISIIALLIGILLPALGAARNSARVSQCLANVRGIGQAMDFYLNDNKQHYPGGTFNSINVQWYNVIGNTGNAAAGAGGNTAADNRILNEYVNDAATIASCPLDKGDYGGTYDNNYTHYGTSYVYFDRTNFASFQGRDRIWSIEGHRSSEILVPTRKYLIGDVLVFADRTASNSKHHWHNNSDPLLVSIAYADGHAASTPTKTAASTFGVISTNTIATWSNDPEGYY